MGIEVGGYHNRADWPKMGPSLLIATALIVAIRTAKWAPRCDTSLSGADLDAEIHFAANVANRVMTTLIGKYESIFPQREEPWYTTVDDEDSPK
jgi:hypothetical protein